MAEWRLPTGVREREGAEERLPVWALAHRHGRVALGVDGCGRCGLSPGRYACAGDRSGRMAEPCEARWFRRVGERWTIGSCWEAIRRPAPVGLAVSCALSALAVCALVGPQVLVHPSRAAVGFNPASDFQIMTWSLEWWPWAIRHGVDPLHTRLLWPPAGFSTLWMTTMPVLALLALPLTLTAGPLVTYNVLMLLAVVLATGGGYLLCRELCGRSAPAVVGGLLFGLSPYMLGHTLSQHLVLTFVWAVPLLAWLVVRRVRGRTTVRRFVAGLAVLLLVLLGSAFELFVDVTLVAALALVLALLGGRSRRGSILRLAASVGLAYAVCLPVLVPVAVLALTSAHAPLPYGPVDYSTDLLNFVVPTPTLLTGTFHSLRTLTRHFVGNIGEQDGYLGLPLLTVAFLAVRAERRRGAWLAGALLVALCVLSLGPIVSVGGRPVARLPFSTAGLPVLGDLLPARLSLFTALVAACLASLWLARPQRRRLRVVVGILLVVSLLPDFAAPSRLPGAWAMSSVFGWSTQRVSTGFVGARGWSSVVRPGANVLVLPTRDRTQAGYWQTEARMRFRLAVPETPFVPPALAAEPVIAGLASNTLPNLEGPKLGAARLRRYLLADRVDDVVVTAQAARQWQALVAAATAARPVELAGSLVYRVAPTLPPLRADGELSAAPRRPAARSVRAWLHDDGWGARLEVLLRTPAMPRARTVTLSPASADAEATSVAFAGGRAAVAFTEWRGHALLVRVATHASSAWRVTTLDTRTEPIWSPEVTITANGDTVVTWIDEADPIRLLRAATLLPDGRWQRPVTLAAADGLRAVDLAPGRGGQAVVAWADAISSQTRIHIAYDDGGTWHPAVTLATSLDTLETIKIRGRTATAISWRFAGGPPRVAQLSPCVPSCRRTRTPYHGGRLPQEFWWNH